MVQPFFRLKEASLRLKIYVSPTLLILSMVLLAAIFSLGMKGQSAALTGLRSSFADDREIGILHTQAIGLEADLYRLLNWQAAGIGPARLTAMERQVRTRLDGMLQSQTRLQAGLRTNGGDDAQLAEMQDKVASFAASVRDVLDVYQGDNLVAQLLMKPNEKHYDAVVGLLDVFAQTSAARSDAVFGQAVETGRQANIRYWAVFAAFLLVGIAVMVGMSRQITGAVAAMAAAMEHLAAGDLTIEVAHLGRRHEIGAMVAAFEVFRRSIVEARDLNAERDRTRALREERADLIETEARAFDAAVGATLRALIGAVDQLKAAAQAMNATADSNRAQASTVVTATSHASDNVSTVAAATEQLSQSIAEIGRQVTHSSDVAQAATATVVTTGSLVQELTEASARIGQVVGLIDQIAGQTNLLALNATIEAARAGSAGKGFGVVAAEVNALAKQTANATKEIAGHVAGISSLGNNAAVAIDSLGVRVTEMEKIVSTIAVAVNQQSAATSDIASNVQGVATGTREVSTAIAAMGQSIHQTGILSDDLLNAAGLLDGETRNLRRQVDRFLGVLRQA